MGIGSEPSGKSKKDGRSEPSTESMLDKDGRFLSDEWEAIPTVIPREGDGYRKRPKSVTEQVAYAIGVSGHALTEEDLSRINTRKGLLTLLKSKGIDLEEVRQTLLYEQELRALQV